MNVTRHFDVDADLYTSIPAFFRLAEATAASALLENPDSDTSKR